MASTSVRLSSNLIETGGESVEVSYLWGTDPSALSNETNSTTVSSIGSTFTFLSGLSPNTTYYYQAKALNSAGQSNGLDLSTLPYFNWELNDSGSVAVDSSFRADGQIFGATSEWDAELGSSVLEFDGDDDYVDLGDIDEMDQVDRFTISLWFKRNSSSSVTPTNHGVHNVLVAQSSDGSNDNLEIGSQGEDIQLYIDSGTAATDSTVTFDADLNDGQWYHIAVVYGSELSIYLDGIKLTNWLHYNGRLESSATSSLSIGAARPDRADPWGEFTGRISDVQIYLSDLSAEEIKILSGSSDPQQFTTGTSIVPPIVRVKPASGITDSNATLEYELVSYDGDQPEIIFYWGIFDQKQNAGLWQNTQSLGTRGIGSGTLDIGGFSAGDNLFYQVRAVGDPYDDWSDSSGQFKFVSSPELVFTAPSGQTSSSVSLHGRVSSNGGQSTVVSIETPLVSNDLLAHWRFDEAQGMETYDSTGLSPTAQLFSGVTWTEGMGGSYNSALQFDGGSLAYVDVGDFRIEGAVSFSAWVLKENLGNWQRVFDFANGPENHNLLLANRGNTNEAEWSIRRGSNNRSLIVQDFWRLNSWQHVVATVNDSGLMKLYRDGELKGFLPGSPPPRINAHKTVRWTK